MNYRMTMFLIGRILLVAGALMLLPIICILIYKEYADIYAMAIPALAIMAIGLVMGVKKPKRLRMGAKEGFISVGLSWILMSLAGAVPFVISGVIPHYVDALFETVSGFTTTGSSIMRTLDFSQHHGIFLWRSLTNWIGGMGILVFMLALLPKTDSKNSKFMYAMQAESPGPKVGKIVPKLRDTARILYLIYIGLGVIEFVLLLFDKKMGVYDSLIHTLSNSGTGGFGLYGDSIAHYSVYSQYVISIFMIIFATNFSIYFLILTGNFLGAIKSEELRWFWAIIGISIVALGIGIYPMFGVEGAFRHSLFQTASMMSTTGFATNDFNKWPVYCKTILLILMFIGGCAGSTGGGIKVSRVIMLIKTGVREIGYLLNPKAVIPVRFDGKKVDDKVIRGTASYLIIYIMLFAASWLAVSAIDGHNTVPEGHSFDIETNFSAIASCLNNIGPGLGKIIGPAGNYADYSYASKLILSLDMLIGRLEIFPIIIIFAPSTWLTSLKYSANKAWIKLMGCRKPKDEIEDEDKDLDLL